VPRMCGEWVWLGVNISVVYRNGGYGRLVPTPTVWPQVSAE
jgi:hypothetical protein